MDRLIMISSIVRGNGAKHTTLNLAYAMARKFEKSRKEKKILLIDFDMSNPTLWNQLQGSTKKHISYEKHQYGIDNILEKNKLDLITDEVFVNNCVDLKFNKKNKNQTVSMHLLQGTNFPEEYKIYTRDDIECILNFARDNFDYVFVVADSVHNNAGFIYTLVHTDKLILLSRNNIVNENRLDFVFSLISQYYLASSPIQMIYNYGNNPKCNLNDKTSGSKLKVDLLGVMEYDPEDFDNLITVNKPIFTRRMNKSLYNIVLKKLLA